MKALIAKREQAVYLRKFGLTYAEIAAKVGVAVSSLAYWKIAAIPLSSAATKRIAAKKAVGCAKLQAALDKLSPEARHAHHVKAGKRTYELCGDKMHRLTASDREKASLAYRKDEVSARDTVQRVSGKAVKKEFVCGHYMDLCCSDFIAEHTIDVTHGVSDAIRRFADVTDSRQKILISHLAGIGKVRRARCKDVILLDIADLNAGKWPI